MSKKCLMIFLVFFSAKSLMAQHLSIGPTAGIGHSWISTDNENTNNKSRFHPAYNVGVKLVYSILSNWGLSTDVKFSSEGGTRGVDKDNKTIARINYLRIPIQGIYFFGKYGDKVRPKISIGPSFGFVVGGKNKEYQNGNLISSVDIKPLVNSFDIGLNAAVGANIRVCKKTWLNADITYYNGFKNINTNSAVKNKNRGLGLNIGVLFPLGK